MSESNGSKINGAEGQEQMLLGEHCRKPARDASLQRKRKSGIQKI